MSTCGQGAALNETCAAPYTDGIEYAVVVLTVIAVLLNLVFLWWGVKHIDHSNAIYSFCVVISVGATILLFSVIAWPLNDTDNTCYAKPVLLAVGMGLMFGMLVARIYKVWYCFIYQVKLPFDQLVERRNSQIKQYDIPIIVTVIMIVEITLLIILYSVDDFRPKCNCRSFTDESFRQDSYTLCEWNPVMGWVIIVLNLLPVLIAVGMAIQTIRHFKRNSGDNVNGIAKEEIDEFYPILKSLAVIFVLFIVAAAFSSLSNTISENPKNRQIYYFFRSLGVILAVLIPVTILYQRRYRVYRAMEEKRNENDAQGTSMNGKENQQAEETDKDKDMDDLMYA